MREQRGFTLIELLVVVSIVAILASIAIPQFVTYRSRAFESAAKLNVRDALIAEQSYYLQHGSYTDLVVDLEKQGFRSTEGVTLSIELVGEEDFKITAKFGKNCTFTRTGSGDVQETICPP